MSISEITGSQSFEEKLSDGKTYTFSALTMKDYGDIENVAKNQRRDELKELVGEKPDLERLKFIDSEVRKVTAFDDIASFKGMIRMIFYSLAHNHSDISIENIGSLLDIASMTRIAGQLTGMVEDLSKNVEGQTVAPE